MLSASETKRCCYFLLNNQKTLKGTVKVGEKYSFGAGGVVFRVPVLPFVRYVTLDRSLLGETRFLIL